MIALDTNVLVRFLVVDDPDQSRRARRLIERATADDEQLFVSDLVLVETVWVLRRAYGLDKNALVELIAKLLLATQLAWQTSDRIARALAAYQAGDGDFADYMIQQRSLAAACDQVATFDRKLLRQPGFIEP
jgi:predicted nucleic-acid-binding protein